MLDLVRVRKLCFSVLLHAAVAVARAVAEPGFSKKEKKI